jgi:hypothetical protein
VSHNRRVRATRAGSAAYSDIVLAQNREDPLMRKLFRFRSDRAEHRILQMEWGGKQAAVSERE